jgi:hypothetical protein
MADKLNNLPFAIGLSKRLRNSQTELDYEPENGSYFDTVDDYGLRNYWASGN